MVSPWFRWKMPIKNVSSPYFFIICLMVENLKKSIYPIYLPLFCHNLIYNGNWYNTPHEYPFDLWVKTWISPKINLLNYNILSHSPHKYSILIVLGYHAIFVLFHLQPMVISVFHTQWKFLKYTNRLSKLYPYWGNTM